MNYSTRVLMITLAGNLLLSNPFVAGQEPMEPSAEHKVLAADAGTWDCNMKIWMAGPDAEPMSAKGSEVNEMLGDFWLLSKFQGDMMGQKFEGRATMGYDPVKKKFTGTWCDTMSPFMSFMEGTYDKESKTMTMMSRGTGPDGQPTRGKNVTVTKPDGTKVFTMYMQTPDSDEMAKMMEITYTKK